MLKGLDNMEVLKLVSHLVITVLLIGAYVYLQASHQSSAEIGTFISVAIGYWFGAVGLNLKSPNKGA